MSDPKTEIDDVDPAEWRHNLENSLKYEISDCSMSDRITFIKKMTDRLKLTLDDIRGVNKSDKYSALNSVPPDVLPIKINLVDGKTIVLLEVNPVITCYEDLLTNVRGDIVHLYVRRKGEELPEDFLPPKRMFTIRPPPPGFVRSTLLKLFSIPTVDKNYVPQPRPSTSKEMDTPMDVKCEEEVTLGVNEDVETFDEKIQEESTFKIIKDDGISTDKKHGTEITPSISEMEGSSIDEKPHEESMVDSIKEEDPSLHDKHPKELIPGASKVQELTLKDKHKEESMPYTSSEEISETDKKHQEKAPLDVSKEKCASIEEKYQEVSNLGTSNHESTPTDDKNEGKLALAVNKDECTPMDEKYQDESMADVSNDEDTSTDEKHLDESILSSSDESNNPSDTKIQEVEPYNLIEIDSSPCSSTDFSNKFQVVGLIETDSVNELEDPEVELEKERNNDIKRCAAVQKDEDLLSGTSSTIRRKRGRPKKCERFGVSHSSRKLNQRKISLLRQTKGRLSSHRYTGRTSCHSLKSKTLFHRSDSKDKHPSPFKKKKLISSVYVQKSQASCSSPSEK